MANNEEGKTVVYVGGRGIGKSYVMAVMKNMPGITFEEACNRMREHMNILNNKEVNKNG